MNPILLFDTSVATTNIGDEIIMDAVRRIACQLFPNAHIVSLPTHLYGGRRAREMLKNSVRGIFQLAAARYTPAPRSMNQGLTPLIHARASCPGRETLNKSAFP